MSTINVLLVTHSAVYTEALLRILEKDRSIRPIAGSDFVLPLPPASLAGRPCIVLFDLAVKRMSFISYIAEIERRNLQARILLYSDGLKDEELLYWLSRGAHGYIQGEQLTNMLITAIKHIASGGLWMPHKIVAQFVERVVSEFSHVSKLFRVPSVLSPREQEVWALISQGRSNKEIARRLDITERTVKFHVTQLLNKFQVTNRRELMLLFGRSNADILSMQSLNVVGPDSSVSGTKTLVPA